MKERPILFSAPMVRAILAGRKTQTRRAAKFSEPVDYPGMIGAQCVNLGGKTCWINSQTSHPNHISKVCPYGQVGDRLWVRETWRPSGAFADMSIAEIGKYFLDPATAMQDELYFKADIKPYDGGAADPWIPSIHMPRWASRINLEITGIRVERLQDINREDAISEGVVWNKCPTRETVQSMNARAMADRIGMSAHYEVEIDYIGGYRWLWEFINGAGSWAANPWVWVVEFRRLPS